MVGWSNKTRLWIRSFWQYRCRHCRCFCWELGLRSARRLVGGGFIKYDSHLRYRGIVGVVRDWPHQKVERLSTFYTQIARILRAVLF